LILNIINYLPQNSFEKIAFEKESIVVDKQKLYLHKKFMRLHKLCISFCISFYAARLA